MSKHYPFATKQEKEILNLLEEKGAMLHNDILQELKGKKRLSEGFSETSLNRSLNEMVEKNWIFRIVREDKPWYRLNDFPLNVKTAISILELLEGSYPAIKGLAQKFKENLSLFHEKMPLDKVFDFSIVDFSLDVKIMNDLLLKEFLKKLKQ
jgi:DNA-binding HxlR family transcriptional regulator